MFYAGIDAHKRTCTICIVDEKGVIVKEDKVPTEFVSLRNFFKPHPQKIRAVVETCLNWPFIYRSLHGYVSDIQVANTYKLRVIAEAKVKTDKVDARTLAHLLRVDYIPAIHVLSEETRQLRELMRSRVYLVRLRTRFKNKIHAILSREGHPTPPGSDIFGKAGRLFLRNLPLPKSEQLVIHQYLDLIEALEGKIHILQYTVHNNAKDSEEIKLLRSIPGIGEISSHLLMGELGSIDRFHTPKHLASYGGLTPRIRASGDTSYTCSLGQAANKYIRWIMTECAQVASQHSPGLRNIFLRIRSRQGTQVAIIAVARRLLETVYHVLKKGEPYQEEKAFPIRHASFLTIS